MCITQEYKLTIWFMKLQINLYIFIYQICGRHFQSADQWQTCSFICKQTVLLISFSDNINVGSFSDNINVGQLQIEHMHMHQ